MALRVTNSLTGEPEPFEPAGDPVTLYYCGLTVSARAHLGHARSWVHVDVMRRWLEHRGYDVRHVENFTDVNEKIVARVGEHGDSEAAVARHFVRETLRDMRSLGLERPHVRPRVSEHVDEIIALVERLVERGYAYEANGSVYFDVTAFDGYGSLSNQSLDAIEPQDEDAEAAETSEKRHPADFALWKADGVAPADLEEHRTEDAAPPDTAATGAETWDSPWGEGRPGWHIECSAMATTHLGDTIDLHVGGGDLVFPHHENEIAQSEAATGEQFARYWLHVALLDVDDDKMSSSLGNFFTVRDAVEEFGADVVRTFLCSAAYRSRQSFSQAALEEATERWERLERAHDRATDAIDGPDARTFPADEDLRAAADEARVDATRAMNDDFDTRGALTALDDLARAVLRHLDAAESPDYPGLVACVDVLETFGGDVLGLSLGRRVAAEDDDRRLAADLVDLVLDIREQERAAGDYDRADALRDDLADLGIEVEDRDDGTTARF
jgi:cysteinyl-tRNA synthetase